MHPIERRRLIKGLVLLGFFALEESAMAGELVDAPRVSLRGYDPVSYFTEGKPEKGDPAFRAEYDNATYWFKSSEHRSLFVTDPERYAPQFGGFCTIDLSRGLVTEPDPEAWAIADGKLYVFGKKRGPSLFAENGSEYVPLATKNWKELRKGP